MKDSTKQTIFFIICILIVFIPTYIAVTYFCIKSAEPPENRYTVEITAHNGKKIHVDPNDTSAVAESVIKMNSKLVAIGGINSSTLPKEYYDIKITDGETVFSYRYYFSVDDEVNTVVRSESGAYYALEAKDTKSFLSKDYAYLFYPHSSLPALSIFGGKDIIPFKAEWKYKAVNGNFIDSPLANETAGTGVSYSMSGHTKLSFSIAPDECTVKVYKDGEEILRASSLDEIPYELLDSSSLSFRISAKWNGSGAYRGSAEYNFSSTIATAPTFSISGTSVESGEFFTVTGFNVSAPEKVEFSSTPSINFTPVFFSDGENARAVIPIDKDLPAPMTYTFKFTYGESVSEIKVSVKERNILERDYDCSKIPVSRNEQSIKEYEDLLNEIGNRYENTVYINSEFIDYTVLFTNDVATIKLGFGHLRIPSCGADSFRLDGVDYILTAGMDVPAVCAGKVIYSGSCTLLGNFVVLDHGFGIKTWYCNLSENTSTVGTTLAKGDSVGKSGMSGYTNSNGMYLITTVLNVPISPYPLQEYEITFPN